MIKKIEIVRNYWLDVPVFARKNIELETGINILVGCNGSGKSTLIHQLKDLARKSKQCVIDFDNLVHGGRNAKEALLKFGNAESFFESAISSEGENIYLNLSKVFGSIKSRIQKQEINMMKKFKEIWIFLDAIDSGLDICGAIDIKQALNTVYNDLSEKGYDVFILVSANTYELVKDSNCFDVRAGKYITFSDYESYRKFIINSNKKKLERYKKINEKAERG